MKVLTLTAASALIFCTPVSAKERASNDDSSESAEAVQGRSDAEEDPNETLCRREEVTGSRLKEKVCRTRKEWKLHDDAAKYDARRVRGRRAINIGTS